MRKFSDLKNFMSENLKNEHLEFTLYDAHFQVYRNHTDMNIAIKDSVEAVIKFEERHPSIFTVAVTFDKKCIINYARSKEFKLDENITSLIESFPDGYLIDDVVAALLKI
jgi:hypothetical protein